MARVKFVAHNNAMQQLATPMKYTLKQAADASGKDKSTIQRAIKSGRISANINDLGNYEIDPSELHRVFEPVAAQHSKSIAEQQLATDLQQLQQAEIESLKAQLALQTNFINTLERLLDESNSERRNLMQLLTYEKEKPSQSDGKELWKKVFKR